MEVELVAHTPNPESFVAFIARVSNPENQDNPDYVKLIKYLLRNQHFSPFEHSYFTFKIVTSRAIAAQILRHRSFTFQEYSQRYSAATNIEPIELRKQAVKNRQSSEEVFNPALSERDDIYANEAIALHTGYALGLYQQLLDVGVAKETARMILPLATQTTLYMTGSVRSFIHYLALRNDQHAQKEHQLIAQEIECILRVYLPTVFTALDNIRAEKEHERNLLQILARHAITDEQFLESLLTGTAPYSD